MIGEIGLAAGAIRWATERPNAASRPSDRTGWNDEVHGVVDVPDGVGQKPEPVEGGTVGLRGRGIDRMGGRVDARVARMVEKMGQHREPTDPVDQCVVHLDHEGGAAAADALDEDGFPQGLGVVEPARGHGLGHVEDVAQGPVFGQADSP